MSESDPGILWDYDDPVVRVAPSVLCGTAEHTLFHGELSAVEDVLNHNIQALVMPVPLFDEGDAIRAQYGPKEG